MGWVLNTTPRSLYPRQWDPVCFAQEARWASGAVGTNPSCALVKRRATSKIWTRISRLMQCSSFRDQRVCLIPVTLKTFRFVTLNTARYLKKLFCLALFDAEDEGSTVLLNVGERVS